MDSRILEAEPSEGMLEKLKELRQEGIKMVLVSHKTKRPYKGPKIRSARGGMELAREIQFFRRERTRVESRRCIF